MCLYVHSKRVRKKRTKNEKERIMLMLFLLITGQARIKTTTSRAMLLFLGFAQHTCEKKKQSLCIKKQKMDVL